MMILYCRLMKGADLSLVPTYMTNSWIKWQTVRSEAYVVWYPCVCGEEWRCLYNEDYKNKTNIHDTGSSFQPFSAQGFSVQEMIVTSSPINLSGVQWNHAKKFHAQNPLAKKKPLSTGSPLPTCLSAPSKACHRILRQNLPLQKLCWLPKIHHMYSGILYFCFYYNSY